jgi:hypothetical protein
VPTKPDSRFKPSKNAHSRQPQPQSQLPLSLGLQPSLPLQQQAIAATSSNATSNSTDFSKEKERLKRRLLQQYQIPGQPAHQDKEGAGLQARQQPAIQGTMRLDEAGNIIPNVPPNG